MPSITNPPRNFGAPPPPPPPLFYKPPPEFEKIYCCLYLVDYINGVTIRCTKYHQYIYLEFGGFGTVSGKIEIDIKINHEGEVNR